MVESKDMYAGKSESFSKLIAIVSLLFTVIAGMSSLTFQLILMKLMPNMNRLINANEWNEFSILSKFVGKRTENYKIIRTVIFKLSRNVP